ncbi:hypothetical protein HI914_07031 [Erysiphe necator]|nr:hypothetical protein HI914_07031 [Erysiphe necator]
MHLSVVRRFEEIAKIYHLVLIRGMLNLTRKIPYFVNDSSLIQECHVMLLHRVEALRQLGPGQHGQNKCRLYRDGPLQRRLVIHKDA